MLLLHCHPFVRTPIFFICVIMLIVVMPVFLLVAAILALFVGADSLLNGQTRQSDPKWISHEVELFPEIKDKTIMYHHRHFEIPINQTKKLIELYYLGTPDHDPNRPTFICLHGTMGFSTNYIDMSYQLPSNVNYYFLDMVGFGKSKCLSKIEPHDYLETEMQSIRMFMELHNIKTAHFIGHSFGGYIATEYAILYPGKVESLTLVSAAGLYPTLGIYGRYYAVLYNSGFPYSLCRSLGGFGGKVLGQFLSLFVNKQKIDHWRIVYGDNSCFGGDFVKSLIELTDNGGYAKRYTFLDLLAMPYPIHFIYGETDDIMPPHQGELFCMLAPENASMQVYKGLWHAPLSKYAIYMRDHLHKCVSGNQPRLSDECLFRRKLLAEFISTNLNIPDYLSTYDVAQTKQNIERFYNHLIYLYKYFNKLELETICITPPRKSIQEDSQLESPAKDLQLESPSEDHPEHIFDLPLDLTPDLSPNLALDESPQSDIYEITT